MGNPNAPASIGTEGRHATNTTHQDLVDIRVPRFVRLAGLVRHLLPMLLDETDDVLRRDVELRWRGRHFMSPFPSRRGLDIDSRSPPVLD